MLADTIISFLKLSGLASGGYLGFRYGNDLRRWGYSKLTPQYRFIFPSSKNVSETEFTSLIGMFSGVLIGYYLWMLTIPGGIYVMDSDHPQILKEIKKRFWK